LLWKNCNQTTTASVGSYWNGSNLYANIGLASTGGFVNDSDPCPIPLAKSITTYIYNNPVKVTSWTELDYIYSGIPTSSGVFNLAWTGTTSASTIASMPIPPGLGAYEVSASLNQALDPNGNIGVSITVTSGSGTGYESPVYNLYSNNFIGVTEASFTSNTLFTTASLNYIVNINYSSSYL